MLKIRLQRIGRKHVRTFRVVLTDSKNSTKSGRVHEIIGFYDPIKNKKDIKADRVKYWISKGAKVSDTVHNFLIDKKVVSGKKINALPRKTPIKPEVKAGEKTEVKAEAPKVAEAAPVAVAA